MWFSLKAMPFPHPRALAAALLLFAAPRVQCQTPTPPTPPASAAARQAALDAEFLAVPNPRLAAEHLKTLTAAPHWASSRPDYATALYVAGRFKAAGLETEIVPYSVRLSKPVSNLVEAFDATGKKVLVSPTRAPIDPAVLPAFNSGSPSADVTAQVVYVNYGRLQDFQQLAELGVSLKDKIALIRYGNNFRGVKVYLAERYGAKGVLLYSDPADGGSSSGAPYPNGPARPDSAAQLGSVQFLPIYPGDPTTPSVASLPSLPAANRIPADKLQYDLPNIPCTPLSADEAAPILHALTGPSAPHYWQGGLGFHYRVGGSATAPVTVHMHLEQDARLRTIWDVIGRIPGTAEPNAWVIAGNHRDAWVFGAADPGSGTAALLEAVHGLGVLLQHGWRPRRTIVIASWDAEEEGLIGSTEWVEQHAAELEQAVAYFNTDVAVSGPDFQAAAIPSLHRFLVAIAKQVPSPAGGTVFDQWRSASEHEQKALSFSVEIGDLGSGSDYTPFLQHAGVPSTDIGSDGPFGVYHTIYDDYGWFTRFADPGFAYTQQQARFLGLEVLHMADASVLPFDYSTYVQDIRGYLDRAHRRADSQGLKLDFAAALSAAGRVSEAAQRLVLEPAANAAELNRALCAAERALLLPAGLPRRPWYRHSIYAPGEFTGYEAVTLPGVADAIDEKDAPGAQAQLAALAQALDRAAAALNSAHR